MFGFKLPTFINLPPHNKFDYKPIYYDPENDKRRKFTEKRLTFRAGAAQEQNSRISGQLRERMQQQHKKRIYAQNSSIRVLMLIAMLTLPLLYYVGYLGSYVTIGALFIAFIIFVKKLGSI